MSGGKLRNLLGYRVGELEVLYRAGSTAHGNALWMCKCSCGNEKALSSDHLTRKRAPVKSCGCKARRRGKNHPSWSGVGDISDNWWKSRVLRDRGNRKVVEVSITQAYAWGLYLEQGGVCSLSGVPIKIGFKEDASIDRIDPDKGYVEGNVQWVHKDINFMKRFYSQDYFIEMCGRVYARRAGGCEVK